MAADHLHIASHDASINTLLPQSGTSVRLFSPPDGAQATHTATMQCIPPHRAPAMAPKMAVVVISRSLGAEPGGAAVGGVPWGVCVVVVVGSGCPCRRVAYRTHLPLPDPAAIAHRPARSPARLPPSASLSYCGRYSVNWYHRISFVWVAVFVTICRVGIDETAIRWCCWIII